MDQAVAMQVLSECNLGMVVSGLLHGKTVIFPTETSYGLGCDATNQSAVDKIYLIKNRTPDKALLSVVPTIEMAKEYLMWNSLLENLAAKFWPGPLRVVGEAAPAVQLAKGVVSKDGTVAFRVTAHPFLKSITEKLGRPLVATSANLSDAGDVYESERIISMFEGKQNQPDLFLNNGSLPKRPPTTIVRVYEDRLEILRQGEVKIL